MLVLTVAVGRGCVCAGGGFIAADGYWHTDVVSAALTALRHYFSGIVAFGLRVLAKLLAAYGATVN
ncbi:MAG: hypothetical protein HS123_23560 [Solibacteraceae bacterium]|nr:hypothetical protein [Solibacteraceae bacterium]